MKQFRAQAKTLHSSKLKSFSGAKAPRNPIDASSFKALPPLGSEEKVEQAQTIPTRKAGGKVHGEHAKARLDRAPRRRGGKVFEGSAKDEREDRKLAKKHHESLAQWERSEADKKHDRQHSMAGLKDGGRTARAKGGKVGKGKTSVNIVIAPGGQQGPQAVPVPRPVPIPVPQQPPAGGPPMGGAMPPGMVGGIPGGPMGAGAPPMPLRARGGKVSGKPHMTSGNSGVGRKQKIKLQRWADEHEDY